MSTTPRSRQLVGLLLGGMAWVAIAAAPQTLMQARRGFVTEVAATGNAGSPAPQPPPELFQRVHYPAPAGSLVAYLTPDPKDGRKRPAIIWMTGGDSNTIDDLWSPAPRSNDQTAAAFREAGMVLMFPSLRGGNDNPGTKEAYLGEVDDILAAADFLRRQPHVDPAQLYLGGHSTGGTLALLVAESTDRFRATFAFGPVTDVSSYGQSSLPFDVNNAQELRLRSPIHWLGSIRTPVFVFEGREQPSNISDLRLLEQASSNPLVQFIGVEGANHFSILAPTTERIAHKIMDGQGKAGALSFRTDELKLPQ